MDSSLQLLFDIIENLVDDRTGIIRGVTEVSNPSGSPGFFHYAAQACNTSAFHPCKNFSEAGGASSNRKIAVAKAVGEAVERYCSALYLHEECPLTTAAAAPFSCVDPCEFALFIKEQYAQPDFRYVPFTRDTLVRWTDALDLASHTTQYVPACMVYVPYLCDSNHGEQPITQPISTGLACHSNLAEATIAAVCEVIERDAFTLAWQAMIAAPPIRPDSLSEHNRDLVERFEYIGDSIRLLNVTLDHPVPCVVAVLSSDHPRSPALAFAASSSPSPEEAVRKSLEELAHTRRYAMQLKTAHEPFVPAPGYANVIDQETHVRLFVDKAQRTLADFLFSSEAWISFSDLPNLPGSCPEEQLQNLIEAVGSAGHRILVKDITTPDVRDLALFVVRAIIPGFHPLFMGHGNRALGGVRLWTTPQALGYAGISDSDNPVPHPFP